MVNVAVLGYGTVGSGVLEVLSVNRDAIAKKAGDVINVKYVLDKREFPGSQAEKILIHDFDIIINDESIDIVVEAMGGTDPAYEYAKRTIMSGKNYCTSNKELVAKHGSELLQLAKEKNKNFLFEASVGGGIPIIRPLNHSLTADEITEITGILNGTTNYILTKMDKSGERFDAALREAQELGYAERNPEADVEGYDTCRKIAILSSLAFGENVDYEDIYTEGITKISDVDFMYAAKMGYSIKLLGKCKRRGDKFYAIVAPFMVKADYPLYGVSGVLNGILVRGNVIGDVMFYGSGAGKLPTASAVAADVVEAARHLNTNIMTIWSSRKLKLEDISGAEHGFFVRVGKSGEDIKTLISKVFEKAEFVELAEKSAVNVESGDTSGGTAFITGVLTEKECKEKLAKLPDVVSVIRIGD